MSEVEARREARRRKILENSENRLQKITGVQKRTASYELEGYGSSQNTENELIENEIHRSLPIIEPGTINNLPPQVNHTHRNSLLHRTPTAANSPNTLNYFTIYRFQIISLIALLVNVLLYFFEHHDLHFANKIFIPLLCFEAIYLFYNRNETNNNLLKYLILFRNIPRHHLMWIIKYLDIIRMVLQDVMIYFFVFICILYSRSIFSNTLYTSFLL